MRCKNHWHLDFGKLASASQPTVSSARTDHNQH